MRINCQRAAFWLGLLLAVSTLDSPPVGAEDGTPNQSREDR